MQRLTIGAPMPQNIGMPKHAAPKWSALLQEMQSAGMKQSEIAEAVGLSQASVSELMNEKVKTTEYSRGLRILAAHRAAMKRKPAQEAT
jgi:antitoxin component HigA of HigAB toxin-antitoxin module